MSVDQFFPANNATNVCADVKPRILFDGNATLGNSGSIRFYDAADNSLVHEIDLGVASPTKTIGGRADAIVYKPVIVDGAQVLIDPTDSLFEYNQTYYVQIDATVFPGFAGIANTTGWRFTTKPAAPVIGAMIQVDAAGTADFCTVQGAIDAIPANNTTPRTIHIAAGSYEEIVVDSNRHNLTFQGAERGKTTIRYANNSNLNSGSGATHRRFMMGVYANDVTVRDLTLHNTTPKGGSQAEALRVVGQRVVVRDCDIKSFQDTLLLDGRIYFWNCYVEGDVDYVWGGGTAYFDTCVFHTMNNGYLAQARNQGGPITPESGPYGFVFADCTLTAEPGVTSLWLNRIDPSGYPYSNVALIDCTMGGFVENAGWQLNGGATVAPEAGFWEHRSRTERGQVLDISGRHASSKQLTAEEAAAVRDVRNVLGGNDDWNPKIAPEIADTPIGWAARDGRGLETTTGGGGSAEVVTVSNQAQLEDYCGRTSPFIIQVEGTIVMTPYGKKATVRSNKTIVGLGEGATILNGGLSMNGQQNVIIRNLTIKDSYFMGDWDGKITDNDGIALRDSHHVWVDHCHLGNVGDGLLDVTINSDFVTVSWCVLSYTNKAMGLGVGDPQAERITAHHNWFINNNQRNSRNEGAWVHHFNNYWTGISFYCNNSKTNAQVLIENCVFRDVRHAQIEEEGKIRAEGNLYFNVTGDTDSTGDEEDVVPVPYEYTLDPAGNVPALVVAGAGPYGGHVFSDNLAETVKVSFQPSGEYENYGYLTDEGVAFGNRGNGYSYGWSASNTSNMFWRENLGSNGTSMTPTDQDRRRNGLATLGNGTRTWEIALPDGEYDVVVACGDPFGETPDASLPGGWTKLNFTNGIIVESALLSDPDGADAYDLYETTVTVEDGRLTVGQDETGSNARIGYIEIAPAAQGPVDPDNGVQVWEIYR